MSKTAGGGSRYTPVRLASAQHLAKLGAILRQWQEEHPEADVNVESDGTWVPRFPTDPADRAALDEKFRRVLGTDRS